jgi:streptogramin lyase
VTASTARWLRRIVLVTFALSGSPLRAAAPSEAVSLPGDRAFPESVTATRDGTLYAGSLAVGGIARRLPGESAARVWLSPGTYGTASVFGVLADEKTGTLWVCSNDLSARGITVAGGDKGSVLKGFDLRTGTGKVSVPFPDGPALCNDMVVGADGAVYVTNTVAPQILRLAPRGKELQVWFSDPRLQPPNSAPGLDGIAFGSDGNLYVDRYAPGDLWRVSVTAGKPTGLTELRPSRPLVLTDAMRHIGGNRFLLIEGGGRLDQISIHNDQVAVETLKDGFATPTGVAPVGDTAWVSEGQLPLIFDPTKKGQQPNLPFKLYPVPFTP